MFGQRQYHLDAIDRAVLRDPYFSRIPGMSLFQDSADHGKIAQLLVGKTVHTILGTKLAEEAKGDAQAGLYAQHLVTATLSEVFRHEYEELKFVNGGLIPWDFSVPSGALSVGWYDLSHTSGSGDGIVADDAEDIPSTDLGGDFHANRAVTVAKSFKYSLQDVETAAMQGLFGLVAEKSSATREEHDRDVNNLVRSGSNDGSIPGLYRSPGISVSVAATGNWAAASADNIEADFNAAVTQMMVNTEGRHVPDTALFPISVWRRITTVRDDNDRKTILDQLKASNPFIQRWDWEQGLNGQADAGSATANSAFVYKNDPAVVRAIMPLRLQPRPPQEKGLCVKVIMRSRYAGLTIPKPMALCRIDGV